MATHQTPACEMTGESRLPFLPSGDLQTEAEAAFRMKLGPAGGPFSRRRREAWRERACVVGSLHVRPGSGLPALRGPAPCLSIFPDARSLRGRRRLGLAARPRLGSLQLGVGEGTPSRRLPIGARVRAARPIGPCGFGHQIQRF